MKIIIFDGQIFQTGAWNRGMGKYVLQLLMSYIKLYKNSKVYLIINTNLKIDTLRLKQLKEQLPGINIIKSNLTLPDENHTNENDYIHDLNILITNKFGNSKVSYISTALFMFDYFASFPSNVKKIVIFYDLIPVMFWDELGKYFPAQIYMKRFSLLYDADIICTISDTVKKDVEDFFGFPMEKVFNIDGGYTSLNISAIKPTSFGVPDKYILFPSGDLPHKNNDFAINGFNISKIDKDIKLLITSHFSKESKARLLDYSDRIIFTDNVSDSELVWLYENTISVLFASKYEGLGIPILDALKHKKPVIASSIPVFKEMTKDAYYYFNIEEPSSIASAIQNAVNGVGYDLRLSKYHKIIEKYTWTNTAKKFHKALGRSSIDRLKKYKKANSEKIAIVSANPANEGISRRLESLNYLMQQHIKVDYYFDSRGLSYSQLARPTFLNYVANTFDIKMLKIKQYKNYKKIIYIIEESDLDMLVSVFSIVLPGAIIYTGKTTGISKNKARLLNIIKKQSSSFYVYNNISGASSRSLMDIIKKIIKENRLGNLEADVRNTEINVNEKQSLKSLYNILINNVQ